VSTGIVVTEALSKNKIFDIFTYQRKGNLWIGINESLLEIKQIMSAKLTLK